MKTTAGNITKDQYHLKMENTLIKKVNLLISSLRGDFNKDLTSVTLIPVIFAIRLINKIGKEQIEFVDTEEVDIADIDNLNLGSLILFAEKINEHESPQINKIFTDFLEHKELIQNEEISPSIDEFIIDSKEYISGLSDKDFGSAFLELVKKYPVGDNAGSHFSTQEVTHLLNLIPVENKAKLRLFDPAFGIGQSVISFVKNHPDTEIEIFGNEKIKSVYHLARMCLISNGLYHFTLGNEDSERSVWPDNIDIVICEPPFGVETYFENNSETGDVACELVIKSIEKLVTGGSAYFVMPKGILLAERYSFFREILVESGKLKGIHVLPDNVNIASSNLGLCILELIGEHSEKSIQTIDYPSLGYTTIESIREAAFKNIEPDITKVPVEYIREQNYLLEPKRLTSDIHQIINDLKAENKVIKLGDVLSEAKKPNPWEDLYGTTQVRMSDLKNDPFDFIIDSDRDYNPQFEGNRGQGREISGRSREIKGSALLITRRGHNLKPTYAYPHYMEDGLKIPYSVDAYTIDGNIVNREFLVFQLHSELVQKQLEIYRTGTAIPFISARDFLNIYIEIPQYDGLGFDEAQVKYIEEKRAEILESAYQSKKDEVETLSKELKEVQEKQHSNRDEEEEKIVDYVNHNVRNHLSGVRDSMELLYDFMKEHEGEAIDLKALDGEPLKGESEEDLTSVKDYFDLSLDGLSKALEALKNLEDWRVDRFKEESFTETNIYDWLNHYVGEKRGQKPYSLEVRTRESETEVLLSKIVENPFENVLNNLLSNAEKHGFDGDISTYNILFDVELEDKWINIHYYNDGSPFRISFEDYISQGKAGGKEAGTGFGGFFINRTLQNMNGIFEQGSLEDDSVWNTHLIIKLPLIV